MQPAKQSLPWQRTARDLTLLIALTVAIHLPFISQAFHLDDVQYLDVAHNVFQNPLFPLDLQSVFEGKHLTLWAHSHPPLNSYVMAGLLLLTTRTPSERLLHSCFLIFPILVAIAFYFLARQFIARPLPATALLVTNPILIVCSHTLMTDVPLLAMWLCGTALFVIGIEKDQNRMIDAAAIPLTAACFYAYQALGAILLLGFYAISRRRLRQREILILCVPVLLLAGWQFSGYMHRGTIYMSAMFGELGRRGWWRPETKIRAAVATFSYLGAIVVPFPFVFWRMLRRRKGVLIHLALALGILAAYSQAAGYSWPQRVFLFICVAGGIAATGWIFRGLITASPMAKVSSDDLFLCLWLAGMLVACLAVFLGGSARYLLPACPVLLLLFLRIDERLNGSRSWMFYGSWLTAQLIFGLCLAQADYQFAGAGRREAYDFQRDYLRNHQPFLFNGEWAFRYYMTAIGGEIMAEDTTGVPGELVVKSRLSLGRSFDVDRSLERLELRTYRIRSPVRLLDLHAHAGFWSDGWGVLPFWFSSENQDEISIYRVTEK